MIISKPPWLSNETCSGTKCFSILLVYDWSSSALALRRSWAVSFTGSVKPMAPVGAVERSHPAGTVTSTQCLSLAARNGKTTQKWKILAKHPDRLNISLRQKKKPLQMHEITQVSKWILSRAESTNSGGEAPVGSPDSASGAQAENRNADEEPQRSMQVIRHLPV